MKLPKANLQQHQWEVFVAGNSGKQKDQKLSSQKVQIAKGLAQKMNHTRYVRESIEAQKEKHNIFSLIYQSKIV